jgi:hypothetical protein
VLNAILVLLVLTVLSAKLAQVVARCVVVQELVTTVSWVTVLARATLDLLVMHASTPTLFCAMVTVQLMPLALVPVILVLHPPTAPRVLMITMVLPARTATQMLPATVKVLVKAMARVLAMLVSSVPRPPATPVMPIVSIIPAACSVPTPSLATATEIVSQLLVPATATQVSLGPIARPVGTAIME